MLHACETARSVGAAEIVLNGSQHGLACFCVSLASSPQVGLNNVPPHPAGLSFDATLPLSLTVLPFRWA